jgi:hypothetical protein
MQGSHFCETGDPYLASATWCSSVISETSDANGSAAYAPPQ